MSLGDYLRLLRARHGGITPWDIEAAIPTLPKGLYRQMEQRYRAVGDDETIRLLAEFYGVSFDDLRWRLDWPRKALSRALVAAIKEDREITLDLWNGQTLTGKVLWWDLGATALATADGEVIVQRHAVERWTPRAADDTPETRATEEADDDEEEI